MSTHSMHLSFIAINICLLFSYCLSAHTFKRTRLAPNVYADEVGVLMLDDLASSEFEMNISTHRQLISSTACSSPPYTSVCTSSNPGDCPCAALTDSEKQQILDAHNHRRDLAASGNEVCSTSSGSPTAQCPSATNINSLFWDEALAQIATYWAHQCIWEHHSNVNSGEQNSMYSVQCADGNCLAIGYQDGSWSSWIGENLAAAGTSSSSPDWSIDNALNGIQGWFDESALYHFETGQEFGVTGHWTQGVWASTRYVGCGYAACDSGSPFTNLPQWFNFVCKYYPGGNYGSRPPYETGAQCSQCSVDRNGCSGDHDGLCGGGQCLKCAADFFQDACTHDDESCALDMLCDDGVGRAVICGNISSQQLIAGVVGSFFALILIPSMVGVIVYSVVRMDGLVDTELSSSSAKEPRKTGRNLLALLMTAFLLFFLAVVSFAFIKSDAVRGENYDPANACKAGWFLEYVCYEFGKALVAIFVMYRVYTALCGTQYEITISPKSRMALLVLLSFLGVLYFILIMLAFFLPEPQFGVLNTHDYKHQYCGFDHPSAVFVFGLCVSFARELALNGCAAYILFDRYRALHQKNESSTTATSKKSGDDVELEQGETTKTVSKNTTAKSDGQNKNAKKSDATLKRATKSKAGAKKPEPKGGKNKNDKANGSKDNISKKTPAPPPKKGKSESKTSGATKQGQTSNTKETKSKDLKPAPKTTAATKTKKSTGSGKKLSAAEQRSKIRRYLICASIIFVSSFICQILLCIVQYPSFFIAFDILVQCVCCFIILWISQRLWIEIQQKRQDSTSNTSE